MRARHSVNGVKPGLEPADRSRPASPNNRGTVFPAVPAGLPIRRTGIFIPAACLGLSFLLVVLPCGCRPPPTDIRVQVTDAATLQQMLRKRAGRVILIDFWATWCGPCKQLFPHVVKLHRELANQGLAVISVSLDDPDQAREVLRFLQQQEADFDNFISQFGTGSQSAEVFELRGDVPMYRLYDRAGQLRYQFSGDPSGLEHGEPLENVAGRVKELLAESWPKQ